MKIKITDIEPNPYRKIKEYPIDEKKVKALMNSINEKTFWDNILVRPHPDKKDKYQLAYGHHRLMALQKLKFQEIDIPCRDIEDATMIQIMAEENLNWSTSPAVMTQTIISAKEFLDAELDKYSDWNSNQEILSRLGIDSQASLGAAKKGAGENTLVKFLGGNWTPFKVRTALQIIKDKSLDSEAIKTIPTMEQARVFQTEVKKHEIPKKTQKKIAKTIKEEGVGKRDIPDLVAEHSIKPVKKEPKKLPTLDSYVTQTTKIMYDLMQRIDHVHNCLDNVLSESVYVEFNLHVIDLIVKLQKIRKELENEQKKGKKVIN